MNVSARFELKSVYIALPVPESEIIAIEVLGGLQTPNLGEQEAIRGREWYRSKEHWGVTIGTLVEIL